MVLLLRGSVQAVSKCVAKEYSHIASQHITDLSSDDCRIGECLCLCRWLRRIGMGLHCELDPKDCLEDRRGRVRQPWEKWPEKASRQRLEVDSCTYSIDVRDKAYESDISAC